LLLYIPPPISQPEKLLLLALPAVMVKPSRVARLAPVTTW
jgi:hypothetical protein